jgi:hypothetical protein
MGVNISRKVIFYYTSTGWKDKIQTVTHFMLILHGIQKSYIKIETHNPTRKAST